MRPRDALDTILWTVTHVDDFLWAVIRGLWAYWVTHPERPVYDLLRKVVDGERPAGRRIRDLPRHGRYVVMSDHHLLYAQAPHDYFGAPDAEPTFRNERIYARLATHYGEGGWTLIENGDVEDLVVPEPAFDRSDCLRSGVLSRLHLGWDQVLRLEIRKRQLARIVQTYAGYYQHLVTSFGPDRIVKLIGNHDAELLREDFAALVPLGVPIAEFAVVAAGAPGEPAVVICHGHQMDPWTCTATTQEVGESITESFAWAGQGADRIWDTTDWGPPLRANNELVSFGFGRSRGLVPKLHHMSETRMMKGLAGLDLGERRPWLILGHTHEPRFRQAERYVNAAAAGRYQDLVWAAEVVDGVPKLVAWWVVGEDLVRGELAERGDQLECVLQQPFGALPALPYGPRVGSLDDIRAAVDAVAPQQAKAFGWLLVRIAMNVPVPAGLLALVGWGGYRLVRWMSGG